MRLLNVIIKLHVQVLAERALVQFPDKFVKKDNFSEILSDERLFDLFTKSIWWIPGCEILEFLLNYVCEHVH